MRPDCLPARCPLDGPLAATAASHEGRHPKQSGGLLGSRGVLEQVADEFQVSWVVLDDKDQAAHGDASTAGMANRPTSATRPARSSSPFWARWLMRPDRR